MREAPPGGGLGFAISGIPEFIFVDGDVDQLPNCIAPHTRNTVSPKCIHNPPPKAMYPIPLGYVLSGTLGSLTRQSWGAVGCGAGPGDTPHPDPTPPPLIGRGPPSPLQTTHTCPPGGRHRNSNSRMTTHYAVVTVRKGAREGGRCVTVTCAPPPLQTSKATPTGGSSSKRVVCLSFVRLSECPVLLSLMGTGGFNPRTRVQKAQNLMGIQKFPKKPRKSLHPPPPPCAPPPPLPPTPRVPGSGATLHHPLGRQPKAV